MAKTIAICTSHTKSACATQHVYGLAVYIHTARKGMTIRVFIIALVFIIASGICDERQDIFVTMYSKISTLYASNSQTVFHMLASPTNVDYTSFNAAEVAAKGTDNSYDYYAKQALASVNFINTIPRLSPLYERVRDLSATYSNILESMKPLAREGVDSKLLHDLSIKLFDNDVDPDTHTCNEKDKTEYKGYKKLIKDIRKVEARINHQRRTINSLSRQISGTDTAIKTLTEGIKGDEDKHIDVSGIYEETISKYVDLPNVTNDRNNSNSNRLHKTRGRIDTILETRRQLSRDHEKQLLMLDELTRILEIGKEELVKYATIDKAHKKYIECFDVGFFEARKEALDKLEFYRLGSTDAYISFLSINPWNPSVSLPRQRISFSAVYSSGISASDMLSRYKNMLNDTWQWGIRSKIELDDKDNAHESTTFAVDVAMDVVAIDIVRPWLDLEFLKKYKWQIPTMSDDCVSPGTIPELANHHTRDYLMPLITQRIVICDKVTFKFHVDSKAISAADTGSLIGVSGNFGPFNINNDKSTVASISSHMNANYIETTINDKTVIGFISTIIPRIPHTPNM